MPPNEVRRPRPSQETRPAEGPTTDTQFTPNRLETPAAQWRSNASEVILVLAGTGMPFTLRIFSPLSEHLPARNS
jgi:hypothetical protein